jgi:two-component system CheB/CheR fusion protein
MPMPGSADLGAEPAADEQGRSRMPQNAFPIVGVGASAGGLEAFRQLLAALPVNTGMAYVLVQHLDPRHDSILAELLAKGSRMPVAEVKEDTAVEPNHVYVTPGQHDVTIQGGMLKLVPRTSTRGRHMPIDSFLRTLAEAQGSKAIGVILSGTASDGTLGVKAIKAEGGIAFAQDPGSAAYDGMPRSAIASGCVDLVLPPERIAQELSRLSHHPYMITPPREERADEPMPSLEKGKDGLQTVLALLRKASGTDFSAYKPATIKRRIARRMALVHVEKLEAYARYLEGHPDEVQALHQDCLITVTSFFRDPEALQVLCDEILPRLLKDRPPGAPIRVWVPGCATGEEVYSIVICLLERAGEAKGNPSFQVFATDLSETALEKARAGSYPESIARDVSRERLARFFTKVDGRYRVSKAIRDMCVFARHDLTKDPPFSRLDLITCRNVLIYLEPRLQQRVLAIFHYALQPSGFLLLGALETAGASQDLFAPVDKRHRIYSKRPTTAPAVLGFAAVPRGGDGREQREAGPEAAKLEPHEQLPQEVDRILLARYGPAGVIVDEKDNIVEFRGQTDPYLEHTHGRATFNLFKMARKGLLLEIHQAIQEARKKDAPVRKDGLSLRHRGQLRRLDLEVIPLKGSPEKERFLLVLFEARLEARVRRGRHAERPPRAALADAKETSRLREELAEATRYLQSVMQEHEAASEELQASNEEVLSANEELQSINEELETAKEELQSSNEELTMLNQELQDRNLQVGRALDYANGIVETVRNPLLILDAGLRVQRANRTFYEYFRVAPEETVGRLLYELGKGQWDIPVLRQALEEVLPKDARFEDFEIEHDFPRIGRRTLVLNARKLCHDSGQESILLAIEDKTEVKKTEETREALLGMEHQARMRAEMADRIKDEFVATLSHELRGPLNAIVGWVHILRAGGIDKATSERGMEAIERGVKAQTRLIEELLDYSRMAMGKLHLAPRLMDLVLVAGAAIEAVRPAVEAKEIGLEFVTEFPTAMVHGDPDRLQQVLWNLLSNAVKFTPRGGRVEVWIGRMGTYLNFRVRDTGQGISRDFLPHVFERFRQADGPPRRTQGGLGLGLAIVKELVELHGGTVEVDSPGEGQGTSVTVSLPIPPLLLEPKDSEAEPPTEPSRPETAWIEPGRTMLEGVRLLVVEDEADSREMLVAAFEQCGAKVSAVASAGEGIEAFQRAPPEVIVCDIGLPGEDGHEFIRKVRALEAERGGRIPALALTAYAGREDRRKALAAGFDLHVPKPAEPAELVAKVAALAGPRGGR